jgi:hypothetical protein
VGADETPLSATHPVPDDVSLCDPVLFVLQVIQLQIQAVRCGKHRQCGKEAAVCVTSIDKGVFKNGNEQHGLILILNFHRGMNVNFWF